MHDDTSPRGDVRNRPNEGEMALSSTAAVVAEYANSDVSFARAVSFGFSDTRLC